MLEPLAGKLALWPKVKESALPYWSPRETRAQQKYAAAFVLCVDIT